ncbi:MAG: DUF4346 domain-containing protein [Halobacteriota archaeon]
MADSPTSISKVPAIHASIPVSKVLVVRARELTPIERRLIPRIDKAGNFVITPRPERGIIAVEHYSPDNTLLHVVEGANAKDIYLTIIQRGWVTELCHAAYLGKELTHAELSLRSGSSYIQDGL